MGGGRGWGKMDRLCDTGTKINLKGVRLMAIEGSMLPQGVQWGVCLNSLIGKYSVSWWGEEGRTENTASRAGREANNGEKFPTNLTTPTVGELVVRVMLRHATTTGYAAQTGRMVEDGIS